MSAAPPKMLLFGSSGLFGAAARRLFARSFEVVALRRSDCDFEDAAELESRVSQLLAAHRPSIVLNAAAYTAVDDCELANDRAMQVNARAVDTLARACAASGALLVQLSTDYVFDGEKGQPYLESDTPRPLSVYGASKLAAERAVTASGCEHLLCRTSGLYGPERPSFVRTIHQRIAESRRSQVVDDQFICPTHVDELARQVEALVLAGCRGSYHTVSSNGCSWYELARAVARLCRGGERSESRDLVAPCTTAESRRPARRPRDSRLCVDKLERDATIAALDWETSLRRFLVNEGWADGGGGGSAEGRC